MHHRFEARQVPNARSMSESSNLVSIEMLLAWPLLIGLLLLFDRRHGRLPLFLSYAYIAGLAVQHWFGGLAHAMPWNPFFDSTNTIVGFGYTTLGLACFVLGTAVAPRPRRLAANRARCVRGPDSRHTRWDTATRSSCWSSGAWVGWQS